MGRQAGYDRCVMTPVQIVQLLQDRFGPKITAALADDLHPRVHTEAAHWQEIARFLHDDPGLQLDWLANLSGVDYVADEKMAVVYDLYSFELKHTVAVKVYCDRAAPRVPSVAQLWPAADWHEREAYDMFGIVFEGHPDLRRILLADDWQGFPLRKDYVFPKEYHGIPAVFPERPAKLPAAVKKAQAAPE
jgi:NADH-quinone oxidoreductase subunit C